MMFIFARIGGGLFVRLFTDDENLIREAVWAIKVCTLAVVPLGVQYELVDGFTGMGCVKYALPLSFFRKFVYFVSLFVIPAFWGAQMVFYAEVVSDVLGPLVSVIVYICTIKKIMNRRIEEIQKSGN